MTLNVGDRVGAMLSMTNERAVQFLGYGVYEGDFNYPGMKSEFPNPRIRLDNGEVVWGMECWWGPEESVKQRLTDHSVVMYRIIRDEKGIYLDAVPIQ